MNIQGFNKLTLLDYPGRVACTVFVGGCDLRCPFCHNSSLVLSPRENTPISEEEVLLHLRRRRGILEGITVSGGEPILQGDLVDFLKKIRETGDYAIKLDTNGTHPSRLASIIDAGLVDKVALDIKNAPERYALTVGIQNFDVTPVSESLSLLLSSGIDYELRTTAVRQFHDADAFASIGKFIEGCGDYYIQNFVDSGAVMRGGLSGFDKDEMESFAEIVRPFVGRVTLRGV